MHYLHGLTRGIYLEASADQFFIERNGVQYLGLLLNRALRPSPPKPDPARLNTTPIVTPGTPIHCPGITWVNTPPAKAGGFGLRLKAGSIGHPTD